MDKGLDIEYSDAFFNMRRGFWERSRNSELADKEPDRPLSQQFQEGAELVRIKKQQPLREVR